MEFVPCGFQAGGSVSEVSDWSEGVCGGAGYCGQPNLPALKGRRALLRAWRDCVLGASSGRLRAQASCWLLFHERWICSGDEKHCNRSVSRRGTSLFFKRQALNLSSEICHLL